jgi:hypothetical protein
VSSGWHEDRGIPRVRRAVPAPLGGPRRDESWLGANDQKAEKLRVRSLKRSAGAQGLQLRHSDAGYALIDSTLKHVKDRNDMSLDEVASWLERT